MTEKYNNIKCPIKDDWTWSLIKDVVLISSGKTPKGINDVKLKPESDIDFYKVSDMNAVGNEKYMVDSALKVTLSEASFLKLKLEEPGTIIFPKRGGAILTNKKRILSKKSAYDLNLMGVKEKSENIENRFLWFWFQKLDLSRIYDGSNVPQINNKNIEPLLFPVAPLPEQRAIVSKIEQLFSDLDNGIENFKKAQEQLKIYRQVVLKNACEGKLVPTEAELARSEGRDYEAADVLLETIKAEKNKLINGGEIQNREPLISIKNEEIPYELPKEWQWVRLEDLVSLLGDGLHGTPKYSDHGDYFFINGNNLSDGKILIKNDTKKTSIDEYNRYKKKLNERTLLVSINGTLGNVAFYNNEKIILGKSACYFNLLHNINKFYLKLLINTSYFSVYAFKNATGSTIKNLSLKSMRLFLVPLPPLAEQRRIVAEVERRLSVCDNMEVTIAESLQKAESLRQSILKKAFEGKLLNEKELEEVRNAPDWEPAEKLLERIKAEKTNIITKKKGKK